MMLLTITRRMLRSFPDADECCHPFAVACSRRASGTAAGDRP
jgi:hypothetical protein